jgi:hypothetical protein
MVPTTLDAALRIMSWSFNALLDGQTPTHDHLDRPMLGGNAPLANNWKAALMQVRGDWQLFCQCFGFPQWNGAERMCFKCRASSTIENLKWSNTNDDAPWRDTVWTDEEHRDHLAAAGLPLPILLRYVVGLRLDSIMIDVLHTVDQGVAAHIIGNILFIYGVYRACFGGGTYEERVKLLAKDLSDWYKRTKCENKLQGELTLARIRTSGQWPKLKGKAAAIKAMAGYALDLVRRLHNGSPHDILLEMLCTLLIRFYEVLYSESQFCSDAVKHELPLLGQKLAEFYTRLSVDAAYGEVRFWKMSPKLHLWEHLLEIQAVLYGNPRYYWCYADEDLVGQLIDIAETCHPATLAFSVLFKWLHCFYSVQ